MEIIPHGDVRAFGQGLDSRFGVEVVDHQIVLLGWVCEQGCEVDGTSVPFRVSGTEVPATFDGMLDVEVNNEHSTSNKKVYEGR